eukprot:jgi/Tetstr1/460719/TSEL_005906.t1
MGAPNLSVTRRNVVGFGRCSLVRRPALLRPLRSMRPPAPARGGRRREPTTRVNANLAYIGLGLGVGVAVGMALASFNGNLGRKPEVYMAPTAQNKMIMEECPALTDTYRVSMWMRNKHVETIFAALFRHIFLSIEHYVRYERQELKLPDGGLVSLDWLAGETVNTLPRSAPVLILLPSLIAGSQNVYIAAVARRAARAGIRPVVLNSRGCAGTPVITPKIYSASATGDLRAMVKHVAEAWPAAPLLGAGWGIGANILLCYLGEEGDAAPLRAAISLANLFDLPAVDNNLKDGFHRTVYNHHYAKEMVDVVRRNVETFNHKEGLDVVTTLEATSIREFDEAITVPCFGWNSVDEYYAASSSAASIPHIKIPTLCIQAVNDPIVPFEAVPVDAIEANENCILVATPFGGHVGWTPTGVFGEPWTAAGIVQYLTAMTNGWKEMQRTMEMRGMEAATKEALQEQAARMGSMLAQQRAAAEAREAEVAGLRKQLQAAQEHARSVQQAQALAASELEGFNHQQHEWQHRMAAAQAELAQLQKWIDMSQVSPGTAGAGAAAHDASVRAEQDRAAAATEAELHDLRQRLHAAQTEAQQADSAYHAAAREAQAASEREHELQARLQSAQHELGSLRAWLDASAAAASNGHAMPHQHHVAQH